MFLGRQLLGSTIFAITLLAFPVQQAAAAAAPIVMINGSEFTVGVSEGDPVSVTVALDPQDEDGVAADWWVAAVTPFGLFWFTLDNGWVPSNTPLPAFTGNLVALPDVELLNINFLPPGTYTFYFAVDTVPDGTLNVDPAAFRFSFVTVGVSAPGTPNDPALVGVWNRTSLTIDNMPVDQTGTFLTYAFADTTLTITDDLGCNESATYTTSSGVLTYTITSVSGPANLCDVEGDTVSLSYVVSADTFTSTESIAGITFVQVFTRVP